MSTPMSEKQKKWLAGSGIFLFLLLSALIFVLAGNPLIRFVQEPERFRAWVDAQGVMAPIAFMGMLILQIVVAVIPGEPLEIAAGYAFGAVEGTLLCMLGAFIGRVAVFLLVRRFGTRAVEVFFPLEKLNELKFLQNKRRMTLWVFFLFFLPGTPEDVLCYIVGLTDLPLRSWLIISAIAPFPSIVTSTIGGDALGMGNYTFAIIVFAVTLIISGLGLLAYRVICLKYPKAGCFTLSIIASWMVGAVAKFISATHMGIASKPSLGAWGEKPGSPSFRRPSTAMASFPCRSMIDVKSYFMGLVLLR